MDRLTRKELKSDKFAQEVGHTFEFLSVHRSDVQKWGGIGVAAIVLIIGGYMFYRYQQSARMDAFGQALRVDDASVGPPNPNAPPNSLNYPTQDAKEKARIDSFSSVAAKYRGSQEGAISQMYLGAAQADKGNLAEAEKIYKDVVDSAPGPYASVAAMSLADIYQSEGKNADAEKLVRGLMDKPSVFVSKEEATLELAQIMAKSNPGEARKLLEPLRSSTRTTVSRAAIQAMASIPQN